MILLLLAPAVIGLALLAAGRGLGRRSFLVAAAVPGAMFAWAVSQASAVVDGRVLTGRLQWVPDLHLVIGTRLDGFALLMVLVISGIGVVVQLYAATYFSAATDGLHRLAGLLLVFTAAMVGVVLAADLLTLFVAWELTSITSYLLIGWTDRDAPARASALQALLTTGAGGLAMLGGFLLIGHGAGTYDLTTLAANPPSGIAIDIALVLVLIGAFTKSAQFPFSAWLPGAMVAPTPVSAFLHSATMVKAGVYLIARLSPIFATYGPWRPLVLTVGLVTMITGGWRALRQYDLKRILAYGTVSQLGFMVTLFGAGTPEATEAGVVLLLAHALFKAALFLVVGLIDHQAHSRDIRVLGHYGPGWAPPIAVAVASGASMAGIPLLFGFLAKEGAYDAWWHADGSSGKVVLAGLVVGSVLTFAYTARLLLGAFRPGPATEGTTDPAHPALAPVAAPPARSWAPAAVLGALTVILGLAPGGASALVGAATRSLDPSVGEVHLALWHGVTPALVLSAVTVLVGSLVVVGGRLVGTVQRSLPHPVDGDRAYLGAIRLLNQTADRVTGISQSGSLPIYLGVILTTAAVVPGWALLHAPRPALPPLTSGPGDWVAAALLVTGGIAAVVVRHRMAAVLCLGAVGFGIAVEFVLQGAPDLALTQVCVDTIGAVVFVLVLRHLPAWFADHTTTATRIWRLAVSALVGVFVFAFIVVSSDVRVATPVSEEFLARAYTEGGGRNVVNVVLVDIRGFDTMGEITVLAVAAMGVYALARLSRRERREERSFAPSRGERTGGLR